MADLLPGWLSRARLATQRQPAPPKGATTTATDGARMRNKVKAAVERAGTLQRYARAAQRRRTSPSKETLVLTNGDRDEIADRLARETRARVKESRRLIEASKRIQKR
jgi:hypothetical protein